MNLKEIQARYYQNTSRIERWLHRSILVGAASGTILVTLLYIDAKEFGIMHAVLFIMTVSFCVIPIEILERKRRKKE